MGIYVIIISMKNKRLYNIWRGIIKRCLNPKEKVYKDYGAKGITVCDEWLQYKPFEEWALNNGYDDTLSIDRVDNSKGYSPYNCRWADKYVQARNRSDTKWVTFNNETKSLVEWCEIYNVHPDTVRHRLLRAWTFERAITTKTTKSFKQYRRHKDAMNKKYRKQARRRRK